MFSRVDTPVYDPIVVPRNVVTWRAYDGVVRSKLVCVILPIGLVLVAMSPINYYCNTTVFLPPDNYTPYMYHPEEALHIDCATTVKADIVERLL